jgi:ribulose kinase
MRTLKGCDTMNVHKEDSFVIGIDCGTESVRAGVFDIAGRPLAYGVKEYPLTLPRPGWAEQNPDDWWHAISFAVREAVRKAGVKPEQVRGISADATSCTVVAMDKCSRHMRNAIIWMDVRAADQARRIAASADPALKYNGWGNVSPEWMPCKALWLKENEPETFHRAYRIMEFTDWIMHKLTGNMSPVSTQQLQDGTMIGQAAVGRRVSMRGSVWRNSFLNSHRECLIWARL